MYIYIFYHIISYAYFKYILNMIYHIKNKNILLYIKIFYFLFIYNTNTLESIEIVDTPIIK